MRRARSYCGFSFVVSLSAFCACGDPPADDVAVGPSFVDNDANGNLSDAGDAADGKNGKNDNGLQDGSPTNADGVVGEDCQAVCVDGGDSGSGANDGAADSNDGGGQNDTGPAICTPNCSFGYACIDVGKGPECLPDLAFACAPCSSDLNCLGGQCASLGGEVSTCLIPCAISPSGASNCPVGLTCNAVGGGSGVCKPDSGVCSCTGKNQGEKRSCKGNGGTCAGSQTCGIGGWSACDAPGSSAELCDGIDNDCNGQTDEAMVAPSCVSNNEFGSCPGVSACQGAKGWVCQAPAAKAEICNNIDDNCNGQTDEPWLANGKYTTESNCGGCGFDCSKVFIGGKGTCDPTSFPPHCIVSVCDAGFTIGAKGTCEPIPQTPCSSCKADSECPIDAQCVATGNSNGKVCAASCGSAACALAGTVCTPTAQNGLRCLPPADGCTCTPDKIGKTQICSKTNALGLCQGLQVCAAGNAWQTCSAKVPEKESCNGVDDNCDGKIDNDVSDIGKPCVNTNAFGSCKGFVKCNGSGGLSCDAGVAQKETCNGQDDDCNGVADDGYINPANGLYDSINNCGGCNIACPVAPGIGSTAACTVNAGKPACSFACKPGWANANGSQNDGCECQIIPGIDIPGDGIDQNCDGVDGDSSQGIFVAKTGSDSNPGTVAAPFATIGKGIATAVTAKKSLVFVAAGAYAGNLEMAAGVSIYGGYGKQFAVRDIKAFESVIVGVAPPAGDAITLHCKDIVGAPPALPTRVDGATILGAAAQKYGTSSYAVLSAGCDTRFSVQNCKIVAGNGADGLLGAAGVVGASGVAGGAGLGSKDIGHPICGPNDPNPGGAAGALMCGTTNVSGGAGGTAICPDFDEASVPPVCPDFKAVQNSKPEEYGKNGQGPSPGKGGIPGGDAYIDPNDGVTTSCIKYKAIGCNDCMVALKALYGLDGKAGTNGSSGNSGTGGSGGQVVGGVWVGGTGYAGGAGGPGSGGGGGGAAGGVEVIGCLQVDGFSDIGGSGGGGGSGGCGGTGGQGGGAGGGSFTVFIIAAPSGMPILSANTLLGGKGGNGGTGGTGGYGGLPGAAGFGGSGAEDNMKTFCGTKGGAGSSGGHGGHAGGGGGGAGGAAVLIGVSGVPADIVAGYNTANTFEMLGVAGIGGVGGSSAGLAGSQGQTGATAKIALW